MSGTGGSEAKPAGPVPVRPQGFPLAISPARSLALIGVRLATVAAAAVLLWLALAGTPAGAGFPLNGTWATIGLLPANLLCLWVMRRDLARRGSSLREALGVVPGAFAADLRRSLRWVLVVNLPFLAAIAIMLLVMFGSQAPAAAVEYLFAAAAVPASTPPWLLLIAALATVPFLLTNAPAEELVYRGYGLTGVIPWIGRPLGTALVSVLFGAQHALFAASATGAVIYFVAFSVWGIMSAYAVRREGRLFPIVLAHFFVNALLCIPGIMIPALGLAGIAVAPPL